MSHEKLSAPLAGPESLEKRLKRCLSLAREHFKAERGCLLVTSSGRELLLHDGDDSLRVQFPFSRRVVGEVMVSGSSVVSFCQGRSDMSSSSASMTLHGVRAALAAPLLNSDGEDMGVLYFDSRLSAGPFSDSHLETIRALALAIAESL